MNNQGCPACIQIAVQEQTEEEKTLALIIDSLNEITGLCQSLERELRDSKKGGVQPADKAYQALDGFFFLCQVAEERIKHAQANGYIHEIQRNHLEEELGKAVERMISLAKRSLLYNRVISDLAQQKPIIAEMVEHRTSPLIHASWFLNNRRHSPLDASSL